jgi:hypothetical protein
VEKPDREEYREQRFDQTQEMHDLQNLVEMQYRQPASVVRAQMAILQAPPCYSVTPGFPASPPILGNSTGFTGSCGELNQAMAPLSITNPPHSSQEPPTISKRSTPSQHAPYSAQSASPGLDSPYCTEPQTALVTLHNQHCTMWEINGIPVPEKDLARSNLSRQYPRTQIPSTW